MLNIIFAIALLLTPLSPSTNISYLGSGDNSYVLESGYTGFLIRVQNHYQYIKTSHITVHGEGDVYQFDIPPTVLSTTEYYLGEKEIGDTINLTLLGDNTEDIYLINLDNPVMQVFDNNYVTAINITVEIEGHYMVLSTSMFGVLNYELNNITLLPLVKG
jgi:hypothetical protein